MNSKLKTIPFFKFVEINIVFIIFLVFFGNIISFLGIPKVIKFLHIPIVLLIYILYILIWTKFPLRKITKIFLIAITLFLIQTITSGILNNVPIFNILLFFSLYMEPIIFFMILLDIFNNKPYFFLIFRKYLLVLIIIEILTALLEIFLGFRSDDIKGTFLNTGGGSHILGYILIFFSLYLLFINKELKIIEKTVFISVAIFITILADAKQAILGLIIILLFYSIINLKKLMKIIMLFTFIFSVSFLFLKNIAFLGLEGWLKYKTNLLQMYLFKFTIYENLLNWNFFYLLFGFGPTEVCSSFVNLYSKYKSIIEFLGGGASLYGELIFNINQSIYFTNTISGSSFFTILTSSIALVTEIGIIGFIIYYFIYLYIYIKAPKNVKFLIIYLVYLSANLWWIEVPDLMLPLMSILAISFIEEKVYRG